MSKNEAYLSRDHRNKDTGVLGFILGGNWHIGVMEKKIQDNI